MKKLFEMSDIITIVMSFVSDIELEYEGDDLNLPVNIMSKVEKLGDIEYDDFMKKICEISDHIYELKTGELNQLNMMHKEIKKCAQEKVSEYLI